MKPACSGDHINVLFVDDDADDRMLFQTALEDIETPSRLTVATNGVEALRVLGAPDFGVPDVIFIDINMPQINGWELLANIKRLPALSAVPVIVYSTSTAKEDKQRMQELGAHAYLVKPVSYAQLCLDLKTSFAALGFGNRKAE